MNSCFTFVNILNISQVTLANYSHIIPVILSLVLGIFVFYRAKFNLFSKVFLMFIVVFSIWLIGDLITWTNTNYSLIYAVWSFLDFFEIVFYILGLYFATVFVRKSDISIVTKIILFLLTLPALFLTVTKQSVVGFYQPACEALNGDLLGIYKLVVEGIILIIILFYTIIPFIKKLSSKQKKTDLILLGSMFLFLSTFGVTEYLASTTGVYEINLYSLFLLPVFLIAIIYSVFELDIFNVQLLGTHYLVVGLVVLIAGQFFFINSATDRFLTILTIIITFGISLILFRNLKRESDQRTKIEKLNTELKDLIQQRESLVHLITHKVKGSFTRTKYVFAEMLNNTFGVLTPEMRKMAQTGLESDDTGIKTIDLVLNASNLQSGTVKYEMKDLDFGQMVQNMITELKISAEAKNLKINTDIQEGPFHIKGDEFWMKEVIHNFIENSIKYTPPGGEVKVGLEKKDGKVLFSVFDNGVGITPEDMSHLFTEGGRGKESTKMNVDSTGYGLYSVKLIADAHGGRVWAESDGKGKGSRFYAEFQAI